MELDGNFTTTNINGWIWPKYCDFSGYITLDQHSGSNSEKKFLVKLWSNFLLFLSLFSFSSPKTLKEHVLTSVWSAQHPNTVSNSVSSPSQKSTSWLNGRSCPSSGSCCSRGLCGSGHLCSSRCPIPMALVVPVATVATVTPMASFHELSCSCLEAVPVVSTKSRFKFKIEFKGKKWTLCLKIGIADAREWNRTEL